MDKFNPFVFHKLVTSQCPGEKRLDIKYSLVVGRGRFWESYGLEGMARESTCMESPCHGNGPES